MPINLMPKLTHLVQWQRTTTSTPATMFGPGTAVTTTSTLNCYVYYGDVKRRTSEGVYTEDKAWIAILPRSLSNVAMNDIFYNVVDRNQEIVLSSARVKDILIYRHYRNGTQFVQAELDVG